MRSASRPRGFGVAGLQAAQAFYVPNAAENFSAMIDDARTAKRL